jgi:protein tyrosine/serine phosphatase
MFKNITYILIGLCSLTSCIDYGKPEIHTICQQDDVGNYQIKWETVPELEGTVNIYVSATPDSFVMDQPVTTANISDGVATYISDDNNSRPYFKLVFNNQYSQITASRSISMDSVQNMRDLGGYFDPDGKMTRWGKVYRSGDLSNLSKDDNKRLDNLHIHTIIDLRTDSEVSREPIHYKKANVIHIPIPMGHIEDVPTLIREERMLKGDVNVYLEDCYLQFVANDNAQWNKVLSIFQDQDSYPILLTCSEGKDRSGYASALLLSLLGIPEETMMSDYMASNDDIDILRYASDADTMSTNVQEAVTILLTANESLMKICLQKIKKEYGSMDSYLKKELGMNEKKTNRIKRALLY